MHTQHFNRGKKKTKHAHHLQIRDAFVMNYLICDYIVLLYILVLDLTIYILFEERNKKTTTATETKTRSIVWNCLSVGHSQLYLWYVTVAACWCAQCCFIICCHHTLLFVGLRNEWIKKRERTHIKLCGALSKCIRYQRIHQAHFLPLF